MAILSPSIVIPANAGIPLFSSSPAQKRDPRLRGGDEICKVSNSLPFSFSGESRSPGARLSCSRPGFRLSPENGRVEGETN
jgi:hypothetical protein